MIASVEIQDFGTRLCLLGKRIADIYDQLETRDPIPEEALNEITLSLDHLDTAIGLLRPGEFSDD